MLEEILDRRNIEKALIKVISNKGTGGIDGMQTEELRSYINANWQSLRTSLLNGSYKPSPVRKVEIPKPQGGKRMLGIPTVVDRLIQQAIAQWMQFYYEPIFSKDSYGFRPDKNAHQAVLQAQAYLNNGKAWVIEMDLEKFFDHVNHDKLMTSLSRKITDKRTLKLIRMYLTSGIMEGGVVSQRIKGTPQGSPLSPLLSNIVLDELDKELEKRGHSYVRYADDVSVYASSQASARRVKENIIHYIETKLKLKVNGEKSKVSRPNQSNLLGFSFYFYKRGEWRIRIANKSIDRIKTKCKEITKRNNALSEAARISKLSLLIRGWVNYFATDHAKHLMKDLDQYVRNRLRICKWKQWKKRKTRGINLVKLGIPRRKAYQWSFSRGYIRTSLSPVLQRSLTNEYFQKQGYDGFLNTYTWLKKTQLSLF